MGQSVVFAEATNCQDVHQTTATSMPDVAIFFTKIGWMGLVGCENLLERLVFGHSSANSVWERLNSEEEMDFTERDWFPELRERLESYAEGEVTDFTEFQVDLTRRTPFQRRVVSELRNVSYGETLSYGELAARAGSPKAARAVGSVMAQNRFPLIVPCHRVVGSGGHLGGFSAPRGISLKKQLLDLEAQAVTSR